MAAVYEWYRQGLELLQTGDAHAAATILERAAAAEPEKGSVREALARAYYGSGRIRAALDEFNAALDISPVNDYAHFGVGLCLGRLGRLHEALGHLKMARVMRPEVEDYTAAVERHEARRRLLDELRSTPGEPADPPSNGGTEG